MTAVPSTPSAALTDRPSLTGVLVAGVVGGVAAAVAATAVAAIARGFGVPLEVGPPDAPGPEPIPLLGFAQMTLMLTAVGVLIALALARWARRPERTWIITAVVLTVLSFAPSVTAGHATPGTKAVLVLTHIVAAIIVIPVVARSLRPHGDA
jgi:hypothetical protein